eukprot:g22570.t1
MQKNPKRALGQTLLKQMKSMTQAESMEKCAAVVESLKSQDEPLRLPHIFRRSRDGHKAIVQEMTALFELDLKVFASKPLAGKDGFIVAKDGKTKHKMRDIIERTPEYFSNLFAQTTTSFSIDADAVHNYWGSSLVENESVIPEDWVMLKIDIEGAEYDVMPCLAEFKEAELIDEIFLEEHWWFPDRTAEQSPGSEGMPENTGVASGGEEWATSTTAGRQQALSWLPKAPLLDAFAPKPLLPGVLDAAIKTSSGGKTIGLAVEEVLDWLNEEALTEAAASSLSELQAQEEQLLQQALAASAGESLSLEERRTEMSSSHFCVMDV